MIDVNKIAVLVLTCLFTGLECSKICYLCNSYNDNDHTACIDPMDTSVNYTTCSDSYVCTRVSYITEKKFVVSRGCDLEGDTCNNIYRTLQSYYPDISTYNCYSCSTDYCNRESGVA